ncbi:MAG: PIN domain nuclease [Deltaproteobacteria bacterium]|nr:PIN domain nuclease [Deltaproteobacteria bacterium]
MAGRVLIDSSVWVDALADPESPVATGVAELLATPGRAATTGVILQEVLQGVRAPRQVAQVATLLGGLTYLPASRAVHARAAALYRNLRARGVTTHTVDVLVAQVALDHGAAVWSLDRHLAEIASRTRLRLYRPAT